MLLELNVNLLAGDAIGLTLGVTPDAGAGGSSPNRRRLALPAAGELYRSWTDSGEGGTSGRRKQIKLEQLIGDYINQLPKHLDTHLYEHCPGLI